MGEKTRKGPPLRVFSTVETKRDIRYFVQNDSIGTPEHAESDRIIDSSIAEQLVVVMMLGIF